MSNDELIAHHQILGHERIKTLQLIAAAPDLLNWLSWSLMVIDRDCPDVVNSWQYEQASDAIKKAVA